MNGSGRELPGHTLHPGAARARLLRLDAPVSFWGGVDTSGRVVDVHHPQVGELLAGRVVAVQSGRGSSSSTAVLAEQIRAGCAPAAMLLAECDSILVVAALVAAELYDVQMPIVRLHPDDLAALGARHTGGPAEGGPGGAGIVSVVAEPDGIAHIRLEAA